MDDIALCLQILARILLEGVEIAMLVRVILSLFMLPDESRLAAWTFWLTEPVILPVRKLCDRFGWFEQTPVDMPFLLTSFAVAFLLLFV